MLLLLLLLLLLCEIKEIQDFKTYFSHADSLRDTLSVLVSLCVWGELLVLGAYAQHNNDYCDSDHKWAFTGKLNFTSCQVCMPSEILLALILLTLSLLPLLPLALCLV